MEQDSIRILIRSEKDVAKYRMGWEARAWNSYNQPMRIPCILLAAGASRRLGEPKQLIRFQGETLLERNIRLALEAGCARVMVVLGGHAGQILSEVGARLARNSEVEIHLHPGWEQGMASSLHAGVRRCQQLGWTSGVMLMVCDQPYLTAAHLRSLLEAFANYAGGRTIASQYGGILGVPVIFPQSEMGRLLELTGDQGARRLLQTIADPVSIVCDGGEFDVDEPEDRMRLQAEL